MCVMCVRMCMYGLGETYALSIQEVENKIVITYRCYWTVHKVLLGTEFTYHILVWKNPNKVAKCRRKKLDTLAGNIKICSY